MENSVQIDKQLYWLGVDDWQTERFENIWPLPGGISYNSYLLCDKKVALVDTVKANSLTPFWGKIADLIGNKPIDYVIINHVEPDHSGAMKLLVERFPQIKIVGNQKTAELLKHFYQITDNILMVDDLGEIDLGKRKLEFIMTPMVHWPETMMTWEGTSRVLFSGDVFGSYGALNGALFDDQRADQAALENESLRYYANVIGRYSMMVQKALTKLKTKSPSIIAPTHGPVLRNNPERILTLYDAWSRHQTEKGAVIAYGSMYGHTEQFVEVIGRALKQEGLTSVIVHNVSKSHPSEILRDIWRYRGLILGTPTYNMQPFPMVEHLVSLIQNKMMRNRVIGIFGSYGWSGGGVKALEEFAKNDKGWELVGPVVEAHCAPKSADFEQAELLGKHMAAKII